MLPQSPVFSLILPGGSVFYILGLLSFCSVVYAKGELRLQSSEYISGQQPYFREGAERSNNSISLQLENEWHWKKLKFQLQAQDEYSGTEQWNYLNIYQAYGTWILSERKSISLGRKLESWSEWDETWRQGVFQPRYLQNKIRIEQAGLTGVFYSQSEQNTSFTLGFLAANIPDLGAHFYVENDKFFSRNPWFSPPAGQFEYRQVIGDIRYSLDRPRNEEVLARMGGIAKVEWGDRQNYLARFTAAYKPMPQVLLGFPSRNRVVIASTEDYMNVQVHARVAYHTLLSHDSVVRLGPWTASASLTREIPSHDASPADYTAQQVSPAWIASLGMSRPLEAEGPGAARLHLGFLKVEGGDAPDRGDFASQVSLFERRYQYSEAYSLGLTKPWRGLTQFPWEMGVRAIYDRKQNGGVLSLTTGVKFSRDFRADLQLDFLGLFGGAAEIQDGFLAIYRANDRIGMGLSYVY